MSEKLLRVRATAIAEEWLERLKEKHGPLLFHQSGGCCDGSAPMCYPAREFQVGQSDVLLGYIRDIPFFMSASQFEYWRHTQLVIDVVNGRGSGFSVEGPEGIRFLTRSHVFTDEEMRRLELQGEPLRGPIGASS